MTSDGTTGPRDAGLYVLVSLLRVHDIGADPEQIRHRFGGVPIGITEMLRCAKEFGLKARTRAVGARLFRHLLALPIAYSSIAQRQPEERSSDFGGARREILEFGKRFSMKRNDATLDFITARGRDAVKG
jgi:hypothetical protein